MQETHPADSREDCYDHHGVVVAELAGVVVAGVDLVNLLDGQQVGEDSHEDPAHELVAVKHAGEEEEQQQEGEADPPEADFCSGVLPEDEVGRQQGDIEEEQHNDEQFVPDAPILLEVLIVSLLHLTLLHDQPHDLLLALHREGLQKMAAGLLMAELEQRRIALDLVLPVLHLLDLVEVVLQSPAGRPVVDVAVRASVVHVVGVGQRQLVVDQLCQQHLLLLLALLGRTP